MYNKYYEPVSCANSILIQDTIHNQIFAFIDVIGLHERDRIIILIHFDETLDRQFYGKH